ncbi:MAG: tetratricopeptide repeat protein [Deltaproteobacteria bacterium]|nr:tetratricopeptide repeat protein [Deltaproteobacteria bacterium]
MLGRTFGLSLVVLMGCQTQLSSETIVHHPRLALSTLTPKVVEASQAIRPLWIEKSPRGAVAFVPFTGQASAPTLDAAKAQAQKDLYAAVSSFISVDVNTSFESTETLAQRNGREQSTLDVKEVVQARSAAQLKEVKIDQLYWEKVQSSPLFPDGVQYRCFAYAEVPKSEILRARLQRQAQREQRSGRRLLVVLPFRGPGEGGHAIQAAMVEELSRRLLLVPTLHVSDPELVRALLADGRGESEAQALETVEDALSPDLVIGGTYQLHAGRVRVSYTVFGRGAPTFGGTVEDRLENLYGLEDQLLTSLIAQLGAPRSEAPASPRPSSPAAPLGQGALEAYGQAGEFYQNGDNQGAVQLLTKALAEAPDFARAYLRLGRVQERMGRYGDLDRAPGPNFTAQLRLCLPWDRITTLPPARYLEALTQAPATPRARSGELVDVILSAAEYGIEADYVPDPGVGPVPQSAAGAYWHAYRLGVLQADLQLALEAQVALGDLALRVDRPAAARAVYERALAGAQSRGLLHLLGLAQLGLGKVLKAEGRLAEASNLLQQTLVLRRNLGEKPYVLELLNELGGISTELGAYPLARVFYEEAHRLATDLGDSYLSAVLDNNLGVLESTLGLTVQAEERHARALAKLTDLGEADGRIATGLNAGLLSAQRGDLETARGQLLVAADLVKETGQQGRKAEWLRQRGHTHLLAGDTTRALQDLVQAWVIERDLGRVRRRLEVENELVILGAQDLLRRGLLGHERALQLGCLASQADQITTEWGQAGWQGRSLSPIVAWSNAQWLLGMARLDGYTTQDELRIAYGDER